MTFTKTVKGDVTKEEAEGALTFQVTTGTGTDKKYLTADGTLVSEETTLMLNTKKSDDTNLFTYDSTNKKWTATFTQIDLGEYTVTETNTAVKISGTDKDYIYKGETNPSDSATLTKNGATLELTDEYDTPEDKEYGYINITKTISGPVTDEDRDGLTFTLTKTTATGTETIGTYRLGDKEVFAVDDSGVYSLKEPIQVDVTKEKEYYTVTETLTTQTGQTCTVTSVINGGETVSGNESGNITVAKEETSTVAFNNEYSEIPVVEKKATINITKTIEGPVTDEDRDGLIFTVKDSEGKVVGSYKLGEDFDLVDGIYQLRTPLEVDASDEGTTYTVEETLTTANGLTVSVSYSVNGSESTEGKSTDVSVVTDDEVVVAFANVYTRDTGSIKITKTIEGPVTEHDLENLTFTVTDKDGNSIGEYKLGDFTKVSEGVYEKIITDVPTGGVKVTETLYDVDGTTCTVSYSVDGGDEKTGSTASTTVTKDTETVVSFRDKYEEIKKDEPKDTTKTVKISKVDATNSKEIAGAEMELYKVADDGTLTLVKKWTSTTEVLTFTVEPGTYKIKEVVAPEGYQLVETMITFSLDKDGNVKLVEGPGTVAEDGTIQFENDPIKVTGKLSVHVVEEKTGRDVPGAKVEVEYPDGTKKTYTTNDKGEIVDENGNTPIDVPAGDYKVTVIEVPEGYEVTTGETGTVTVPENKEGRHEAKIIPKTGGLKVQVLEEGSNREVPNATVEIEAPEGVTFPDGSTKITAVTDEHGWVTSYKDKNGNTIDITSGLIPGDYKVTVVKVPEGYKVTTGETKTVTVKKGEVAEHKALIATAATKEVEEQKTVTTPSTPSTPSTTTPAAPSTPQKTTSVVNTSDTMNMVPVIVIMIISLIAVAFIIIRKRRLNKEK